MSAGRPLRPTLLLCTALSCAGTPSVAQQGPSLLDLIRPERLVQYALQSAVMGLRTQMDVKYGDMSVWFGGSRVGITEIEVWPLPDWDGGEDCRIAIDRLTLKGAALDVPDTYRASLTVYGVSAPINCLPPDGQRDVSALGITELALPQLSLDISYHVPSAAADIHLHAMADGLAAVDATAHFPYLWMDARDDMDEPLPVIFLSHAAVSIENLGGWDRIKGLIPPPFTDPASAGTAIEGLLGSGLAGMNRDTADPNDTSADPSALSQAQSAFLASVKQAWPAFLEAPQRLVLETGMSASEDVFLDVEYYADAPKAVFDDVRPRVTLAPASAQALIPPDMLQAAISGNLSALSEDDKRRLGMALLTGNGAPRHVPGGTAILSELARAGDGDASLELARALMAQAPEDAYRWALLAGASATSGATGLLDRLEQTLPMARVLELQAEISADVTHPIEALASLPSIRAEARARLTGRGQPRSYGIAALWATLASAAGDAEGAAILKDLDERVRLADPDAAAIWDAQSAEASDLAMEAWLGQDMPRRLGLMP